MVLLPSPSFAPPPVQPLARAKHHSLDHAPVLVPGLALVLACDRVLGQAPVKVRPRDPCLRRITQLIVHPCQGVRKGKGKVLGFCVRSERGRYRIECEPGLAWCWPGP